MLLQLLVSLFVSVIEWTFPFLYGSYVDRSVRVFFFFLSFSGDASSSGVDSILWSATAFCWTFSRTDLSRCNEECCIIVSNEVVIRNAVSPPRTFFCALVCQTVIPEGCPTVPSPTSVREVCGLQPSIEILQIYTYLNDVIINYARDLCLLEYSDLTALCIHFNKDFKHNSLLYVCVCRQLAQTPNFGTIGFGSTSVILFILVILDEILCVSTNEFPRLHFCSFDRRWWSVMYDIASKRTFLCLIPVYSL
jgi:hypothetical protein